MEYKEDLVRQRYGWEKYQPELCFKYRYDPVPMLWKRRRSRYFRTRIRTTQEKRWSYAHNYFRARRNAKNLTDSWDDWVRGDQKENSWKRQGKKKHQWE